MAWSVDASRIASMISRIRSAAGSADRAAIAATRCSAGRPDRSVSAATSAPLSLA